MSTRKPVSIGQILDRVGKTSGSRLNDRSRALDRLEHQLDQWLPAELIGRVKVGNFRNNELILFVDSSSWAARLRFVTPQLLQKLRQDGRLQPERIQVRILPQRSNPQPPPRQARMSEDSAAALEATAKCLSDPDLADAVARLSQRGRKNNPPQ